MITATPIRLGENNVWPFALDGGGWLLVDAGVDYDDGATSTWALLVEQARAIGFAPPDVRTVVVTHEHIDHAGFAARWAAEGARIVAMSAAIPSLAAGLRGYEATRAARVAELRRHGCPDEIVARFAALYGARGARWEPCPASAIDAAEECMLHRLADGRTLRLIAAPGHTPGNLVALVTRDSEGSGDLCSGDTLLPTTVPTPGLHFPGVFTGDLDAPNLDTPRWPSLPPFMRSVEELSVLLLTRILPGHGEVVDEPWRLFQQFAAHHRRRARRVREHLAAASADGCSAYEIARGLFPRLPPQRVGQAMTEVIGHLDVLEERGEVWRLPDELLRYRLR